MSWSERTVDDEILVKSYTINDFIIAYLNDELYVNRRYQRKLVWDLKDKRLLIDSIINGIPLPSILIAKYEVPEKSGKIREVIDGLQRLNAIISFMLGEFGVKYNGEICYYDPQVNSEILQLLSVNDSRLKHPQSAQFLPRDVCVKFYQTPISVTEIGKDDDTIELIFGRLNSTGRKVSSQDLRQSKATGEFADLVRRVASDVRLDNTFDDRVCFSDIYNISVGQSQHGYGVDIDTVFWRRHDLIGKTQIKESKDEEIIETLLATILLDDFTKNRDNLDNLYFPGTKLNSQIEEKVSLIGKDVLEDKFKKVFDHIDMIFDSVDSNFSDYLFAEKRTKNKDECFKVLYIALYNLKSHGYIITDYAEVAKKLKKSDAIFNSIIKLSSVSSEKIRNEADNLYEILKPCFSKEIDKVDSEMTPVINKRLSYSKIESQMTEFKIGVSNFTSNKINSKVIQDICRTLVAMSNVNNSREDGLLIVGVADNRDAYNQWRDVFKTHAVISNQHYIPGVRKEAEKLFGSLDNYYRELRKLIKKEPISDKLKEYILENFEIVDYSDVELLVFRSKNVGEISLYNSEKWVRQSSETIRVK